MAKKDLKKRAKEWNGGYRQPVYSAYQRPTEQGRKPGVKNLVKLENGNFLTQGGFEVTVAERKALEAGVAAANRKRKKMIEEEAALPRLDAGRETGQTVGQLQAMGRETDFILARKSASLQQFKSREDFDNYMENLRRVNAPGYLEDRIRLYKRNHMKALQNEHGDEAKDIIMKIRMMKPLEYMRLVQSDEALEVAFVYDPAEKAAVRNKMRAALGMKPKDEDIDGEFIM